jgi:hypothetical protein
MKTKLFTAILFILLLSLKSQTQIPPSFFGLNYWFTNYTGAPFTGSLITTFSPSVKTRNAATDSKLMRVGGTAYNLYFPGTNPNPVYPSTSTGPNSIVTPAGYVKIVDDVRANGFEPMIQVPYDDRSKVKGLEEQAADAAAIVRAVNIIHKRKVKYWIISNEPTNDQGALAGYADPLSLSGNRLVSTYLKKYSVEMKKVDPSISVIGPELTSTYMAGLSALFADPGTSSISVTGTIPATFDGVTTGSAGGKYFVDYASFHSYPGYNPLDFASATAYSLYPVRQRYVDGAFNLASQYQSSFNTYMSGSYNNHLSMMIDEFNMVSAATGASSLNATSIAQESLNANTFLAGQLIADMMGAMLTTTRTATTTPYQNCNLWSCVEVDDPGYLDATNADRKPTYWHYWLMSNFFKGDAYKNTTLDPGPGNIGRCYRAYGSKGPNYIAVLVINQAQTSATNSAIGDGSPSKTLTISFQQAPADFSFNMGVPAPAYTATVPNKSTHLYFFNCNNGAYQGHYEVAEGTMTASPTTFTPASNGTIPLIPSLTVNGNGGCYGSVATINAPASAIWYEATNTNSLASGTSFTTSNPGLYYARISGSCNSYWLAAVVNQTTPIASRSSEVIENCSSSPTVMANVGNGGYTYAWAPTANVNPTNSYSAAISATTNNVYSVSVSSGTCSITETISLLACNSSSASQDVWIKDCAADVGTETNTDCAVPWYSPDIWISTTYTGGPGNGEYHTNGVANYIHAVVRNKGSSAASGLLNLYWTKATTGASFPGSWTNTIIVNGTQTLALGDQISYPISFTLPAGPSSTEIIVPWVVPNPNNYNFILGNPTSHFCVYARLVTGCAMTETGDMGTDIFVNNGIAQSNLAIYDANPNDSPQPRGYFISLFAPNNSTATATMKFKLTASVTGIGTSIFDYGNPYIKLNDDIYDSWVSGGSSGVNIADVGDNTIKITGDNATISNISMPASTLSALDAKFLFHRQPNMSYDLDVDLAQYEYSPAGLFVDKLLGGEHFIIKPVTCPSVPGVQDTLIVYATGCGKDLKVLSPQADVEYTWFYNSGGVISVAGVGTLVTVYPTSTTIYSLEAAKNGCIIKGSNTTRIVYIADGCGEKTAATNTSTQNVMPVLAEMPQGNIAFSLKPNPANDRVIISYDLESLGNGELIITNSYGQQIAKHTLDPKRKRYTFDCSEYTNGIYYVSLVTNNKMIKTLKLVVMN